MCIKNDVTKAIFERQTIREYRREQISDEHLETLMKAAMQAPSGRNTQPCHVRFIKGFELLDELNHDFKEYVGYDTPAYTRWDTNPVYQNAPTLAMIFSKDGSAMNAGIMVENIAICAQGIGLNTAIIASVGAVFNGPDSDKWKDRLKIPRDFKFDISIAIGYGDESPEFKPRNEDQYMIIE